MLFAIDWFKRRRFAAKQRTANPAVPPSLPFSIEYTSTWDDLIQGFEAERISRRSRADRWVLIVLGWGWFILAIVAWLKVFPQIRADKWWQPLLPLTAGVGLLWYNVAKPFFRKRQIRANNPASQKLQLVVLSDGIQIMAEGIGTSKRTWDELAAAINAKKGLLIYFTDGIANWLPQRAFQNNRMKEELYTFLVQRLVENEEQQPRDAESESHSE